MKRDLDLIAGEFLAGDLPVSKKYLDEYFRGVAQQAFVKYYLTFSSHQHFSLHSGIVVTTRWLQRLEKRFKILETALQEARSAVDLEKLADIQSGKFKPGV